ncbi:DUF2169 domain-containing protein [Serratia sp. UGAL515B_01]|uniref:DUF2169 family type VI secretion system accessory protein n=1 Tax=Serratia sp. UGAL515B_01 TaxID=2986763 RepID=UPI002953FA97|nr:DUF2169 domain-containing protein [Serratia sp. UGAL515B_01]WON76729.1 DUF2169 domain-containing protein [Serratia sp. UGAL515B_01]
MANFKNYSFFSALQYKGIDQNDTGFHVVVARVVYDMKIEKNNQCALTLSSKQESLNYSDINYKDMSRSSVKYESDLAPYKPKTDIIINATAYSPHDQATPSFNVSVMIGNYKKSLRIHGPRSWLFTPLGWSLGFPKPIKQLDITYEYASGGWYESEDKTIASPNNPLGMGWYPAEYLKTCKVTELPAPQIESETLPVVSIKELILPEGFGFFGRGWHGRIEYAGTYDNAWVENRHPYLPEDFNFRYWCGAHPTLQISHPKPCDNIPVELFGLLPASEIADQHIRIQIPVETLFIFFNTEFRLGITKDMILDTIIIDMNARKVFCSYRITLAEELNVTEIQLRYIAVDHRQKQIDRATAMRQDLSSTEFIPLPPSLLNKGNLYG